MTEVHSDRLKAWQSRSKDKLIQCRQIYANNTSRK